MKLHLSVDDATGLVSLWDTRAERVRGKQDGERDVDLELTQDQFCQVWGITERDPEYRCTFEEVYNEGMRSEAFRRCTGVEGHVGPHRLGSWSLRS